MEILEFFLHKSPSKRWRNGMEFTGELKTEGALTSFIATHRYIAGQALLM